LFTEHFLRNLLRKFQKEICICRTDENQIFEGGDIVKLNSFLVKAVVAVSMLIALFCAGSVSAASAPRFKILIVSEDSASNPIHYPMVLVAKAWFAKLATDSNIVADWVSDTKSFTDAFLAIYRVIVQINFSPLGEFWTATSKAAFQKYVEQGTGGWIGMHHASLYGSAVGETSWPWYQAFIGGCQYTGYIAGLANATVRIEDTLHPCMRGVPKSFSVAKDEWYTWSPNPRTNKSVHVLGNVDESTYSPSLASDPKMGPDHPVIWSNESTAYKGRLMYMFMGHSATCYTANTAYTTIVRNAVFWAAATGTEAKGLKDSKVETRTLQNLNILTDRHYVSVEMPESGITAKLTTVAGSLIASANSANSANGVCRIDRSRLPAGIYIVNVSCRNSTESRRFLLD